MRMMVNAYGEVWHVDEFTSRQAPVRLLRDSHGEVHEFFGLAGWCAPTEILYDFAEPDPSPQELLERARKIWENLWPHSERRGSSG